MAISFDAPLSGMQAAITRQDVTANDVANVNTTGYEQTTPYQTELTPQGTRISRLARTPNSPEAPSNTDLVEETREQKINKAAFQADIAVIKAQDRMTGNLLDLFA
jgi:flagellar hook protein FlgE